MSLSVVVRIRLQTSWSRLRAACTAPQWLRPRCYDGDWRYAVGRFGTHSDVEVVITGPNTGQVKVTLYLQDTYNFEGGARKELADTGAAAEFTVTGEMVLESRQFRPSIWQSLWWSLFGSPKPKCPPEDSEGT